MLKYILKQALFYIGWLTSYICPRKIFCLWEIIRIYIYTGWISRRFKHFGSYSIIHWKFCELKGEQYISIGNYCQIRHQVRLTAIDRYKKQHFSPKIMLGDNSSIGSNSHITAINCIKIGNNVRMGDNILITDNSHGLSDLKQMDLAPNYRPLYSKGPVVIEDNVWIGEKSSILPGVHIGQGSIIGANSVVTKDIPAYSVVVGSPMKIIVKNEL